MAVSSSPIAAILFDFDGVLVASEPLHYRCWLEAVSPYGGYMDWAEYNRKLTGKTDREAAKALLMPTETTVTEQLIQQALSTKMTAYQNTFIDELSVAEDIAAWIHNAPSNLCLGVVSTSCESEVDPLLHKAGIHSRLNVRVFGDQVEQHKPHPEPYLKALAGVNAVSPTQVTARQCVVVEDSESGIAAAKAAGMTVRTVEGPHEVVPTLVSIFC